MRKVLLVIALIALLPTWAHARNDIAADSFRSRAVPYTYLGVACATGSAPGTCAPQTDGVAGLLVSNAAVDASGNCIAGSTNQIAQRVNGVWKCASVSVSNTGITDPLLVNAITGSGVLPSLTKMGVNGVYPITAAGALCDSSTDNVTLIQGLINTVSTAGGGTVYVPKCSGGNYYAITSRLVLKPNVSLIGAGYASYIKNTTNSSASTSQVIALGTYDAASGTGTCGGGGAPINETQYGINTAAEGDETITTTAVGDAGNFNVGDYIGVWAGCDTNISTHYVATYSEINIVTSKDATTGIVGLKFPARNPYSSGKVFKWGSFATFTHDVEVGYLRIAGSTSNIQEIHPGGVYNAYLHDLTVDGNGQAVVGSAVRHMIVERVMAINGLTDAIDVGFFSHDITIRDCTVGPPSFNNNSIQVRIEERVYDFMVANCRVAMTGLNNSGKINEGIVADLDSYRGSIINNIVYADDLAADTVADIGILAGSALSRDILVQSNRIHGADIGISLSGTSEKALDNTVVDTHLVSGSFAMRVATGCSLCVMHGNTVERTSGSLDGTYDIVSDAGTNSVLWGNTTAVAFPVTIHHWGGSGGITLSTVNAGTMFIPVDGTRGDATVEQNTSEQVDAPCTVTLVTCSVGTAPGVNNSYTFRLRKNLSDTSSVCSTGNATTCPPALQMPTLAAGDLVDYQVTTTVGGGAPSATRGYCGLTCGF